MEVKVKNVIPPIKTICIKNLNDAKRVIVYLNNGSTIAERVLRRARQNQKLRSVDVAE